MKLSGEQNGKYGTEYCIQSAPLSLSNLCLDRNSDEHTAIVHTLIAKLPLRNQLIISFSENTEKICCPTNGLMEFPPVSPQGGFATVPPMLLYKPFVVVVVVAQDDQFDVFIHSI